MAYSYSHTRTELLGNVLTRPLSVVGTTVDPMKVGIYIDGYNLYYGGRGLCGRSTPGWRWLDLQALASDHLLIDVLTEAVDAAMVISNDSDLAYPVSFARDRVSIGLVNPTKGYRAGKLAGEHTDSVGNHWWYQMQPSDWYHQLPTTIGPRSGSRGRCCYTRVTPPGPSGVGFSRLA